MTKQTLDGRHFRNTIGMFATGVAVIVARAGEEALAMTVNAVSSVSLDPMLVLFCPGKKTRLAQRLVQISGFTINFLRHDQQDLSTFFAGGWKKPDPPHYEFVPSKSALRLEGCIASVDCMLEQRLEMGDHWLVIGRVVDLHTGAQPHKPLLFYKGQYRYVDFSESAPAPDLTNVHDVPFQMYYDGWD